MSTDKGTRYQTATAAMVCNGVQRGTDGQPAFSLWTLDYPGHAAHGATTTCPVVPTIGDLAQAIERLAERFAGASESLANFVRAISETPRE